MSDKPNLIRSMQLPPVMIHKYERYLPTAFDESLSVLEKINKTIHYLHEYSRITEDMLVKWNEVYEWVMGEGLKQGILERLNEWLDDGTLARIINEEIFGELNGKIDQLILDMSNLSTELKGEMVDFKNKINDDFIALKNEIMDDLLKKVDNTGYYHEVSTTKHRYESDENIGTTYYLTKIPKYDDHGQIIKMKHGFSFDDYDLKQAESVRDFSVRKGATVATNVSPYSTTTKEIVGLIIQDGTILQNRNGDIWNWIIAYDDENNMKSFPPNTSPTVILSQGFKHAVTAFAPMIENGSIVADSVLNSRDIFLDRVSRQAIAKDVQGNIYIVSVDGRKLGEGGMTARELAQVLLNHGMVFAHMLDGGGSSQTVYYHSMINKITDRDSDRERELRNFLYFGKDKKNDPLTTILAKQGDINYFRQTELQQFSQLRYTRGNYISLIPYLINGWEEYSESGSNHPRAWILPNMTMYIVGTVRNGALGTSCMLLPESMRPMFSTHHLVAGNGNNEIYKIIVGTSGNLTIHPWSVGANENYVKLDGLFFPINPVGLGI